MQKINHLLALLVSLLFLTGCWDVLELDDSIMIRGIGLSKQKGEYHMVMEAVYPSEVTPTDTAGEGESVILETKGKTILEAVREMIRVSKRRLLFTHAEIVIVDSDLAENENMMEILDFLRREEMLRLNSYLVIADYDDMPTDIFSSDPLFNEIISEGILTGMDYKGYVSSFIDVRSRDFIKMLKTPLNNAYLPIIQTSKKENETKRKFTGTAIFNEGKMTGSLDSDETEGLLWLNDRYEKGGVSVDFDGKTAAYRVQNSDTDSSLHWTGDHINANIHVQVEGDLAELNFQVDNINEMIKDFEKKVSEKIKQNMETTLKKLQNDLKTDVTSLGVHAYRNHSEQFKQVKENWNDFFADASIHIDVDVEVKGKGFIKKSSSDSEKEDTRNSYPFTEE